MIGYMIFTMAIALSIACIAYDTMAQSSGWPVGSILVRDASPPKIAAIVTIPWVLVRSFLLLEWWSPFFVLAVGFVSAFFITIILKKHTQVLCILGIFPAFALTVLYSSEQRPFGILHLLLGE